MLDDFAHDVRHAARTLGHAPGFALVAILTLGLGIGATTAISSVVDTVLLQPLPFPDSDRLVRVIENFPHVVPGRAALQRGLTYQEFLDWRTRMKSFADATAVIPMAQRMVRTKQGAAGLWGGATSAHLFTLLQVRASLGRTLVSGDEANPDVVVLSHDTWQRHFASDPDMLGTLLELRTGALMDPIPARVLTVVGVLPADFELPTGPLDFYVPYVPNPAAKTSPQVTTIGRLAPGVPVAAAEQEANALGSAMRPPWPATATPLTRPRFEVQQLKDQAVRTLQPALRVLLASVVVVLLIVCANVANLLLARGTARQRDIAVRLAIGATRGRIIRQVLAECVVLALAGGALGALLGAAGVTMVKRLATVDAPGIFRLMFGSTILPRGHEVSVDWKVLAIALALALVTSIAFGLLPALRLSRANALHAMGSRGGGSGRAESRLRAALVVSQLVLATVLLVGAGLLTHSFVRLASFDKGYDPESVLTFNLLFPDQYSVARKGETIETLLTRLRGVAGVQSAGFARHGILIGEELYIGRFVPPGRTLEAMGNDRVRVRSVSDGYLTAMGVPVVLGRELDPRDSATAPMVVVLNQSAARQYFPGGSAVGQTIAWHLGKEPTPVIVAGVVADVRQRSATDELRPEIFVDYRQLMHLQRSIGDSDRRLNEGAIGFLSFALRTAGDPAATAPQAREIISGVDPNIGIDVMLPMARLEASATARERFYAVLLGAFASVAGLLAAIGVYGVLAYAVVQRTREIGIRMALGARQGQVLGLVLRQGLAMIALGLALGLLGAAAAARYLQSLLFGITPLDQTTFIVVALAFGLVAMLASYVPARRATRVDPMAALRTE